MVIKESPVDAVNYMIQLALLFSGHLVIINETQLNLHLKISTGSTDMLMISIIFRKLNKSVDDKPRTVCSEGIYSHAEKKVYPSTFRVLYDNVEDDLVFNQLLKFLKSNLNCAKYTSGQHLLNRNVKIMKVQLEKNWTWTGCLKGLQEKAISLKGTCWHDLGSRFPLNEPQDIWDKVFWFGWEQRLPFRRSVRNWRLDRLDHEATEQWPPTQQ